MDRSWIRKNRLSREYKEGVEQFLRVAEHSSSDHSFIRCPCNRCENLYMSSVLEIKEHLFKFGFDPSYKTWIWHGEDDTSEESPEPTEEDYDIEGDYDIDMANDVASTIEMAQAVNKEFNGNVEVFEKLLQDAEKPLYENCNKYTKLSAIVKLFNLKARNGWSDKSFSDMLTLFADMLPEGNELPLSLDKAKRCLSAFGMEYKKIHACPNDCILYRKEYENAVTCPTCQTPRYKNMSKDGNNVGQNVVPRKVLWYFPPIPRFQRLFQSMETAKELTWHANEREVDGQLRHPADSPTWKLVDTKWPEFGSESRNLRLAVSADGINPHGSMRSRYSCWPIILTTYNLPPWLCMKRKYMMLTMLISGPKQPGNDIDVYLAPLIDDLKSLWEDGVKTYDAHRKEYFRLRAILLWIINDFPAYGNLSGCAVKGYYACPICGENTYSRRLKNCRKCIYMGHRRYLPTNHPYRNQRKAFNGEQEHATYPKPLSGEEVLIKVGRIKVIWGKKGSLEKQSMSKKKKKKKRKRKIKKKDDIISDAEDNEEDNGAEGDGVESCWRKKSIFFELEYWKHLPIRHNLDVMHIEKNVCDSIIGTLLNIPGKTKDGVASRLDLEKMGIREELAPQVNGNRMYLPPACYTLSRQEKRMVCQTLFDLKVPSGYSSNFRNCVSMEDLKLYGLKSHDCHMLMQQLLPVAIRGVLPKHVRYAIIRVCFFFNAICAKVVDVQRLQEIQKEVVLTLCLLEKFFPPSFFDIMVHLMVHLVREVELGGPVFYRWMYQSERFMQVLKGYVRNRNRPEGCIAQCYIAEEAIEFCSEFICGLDPIGIPSAQDDNRPIGGGDLFEVERVTLDQAHLYVLHNTNVVEPYVGEHKEYLKELYPRKGKNLKWLDEEHNRTFITWLHKRVEAEEKIEENNISEALKWIARGPRQDVMKYPGYVMNDIHYLIKDRDDARVSQNSGVCIVAKALQVASAKDNNPVLADMAFYGVIREVWVLDYFVVKIPLFKCDWVDSKRGIRIDELGTTSVELGRVGHKSDSFILASQAKQVFYVADQLNPGWSVALDTPQTHFPNEYNADEVNDSSNVLPKFDVVDEKTSSYVRDDCEGTWIDNGSTWIYITAALDSLNIDGIITAQPTWEIQKCPLQEGGVECGYFVLKFMRELMGDISQPIEAKMRRFAHKETYTMDEINVVRRELIEFLVEYM